MSTEELVPLRTLSLGSRVSVVGIGGAGNNLLARAIGGGISPSFCIAVNTDKTQLSRSPANNKVLLDGELVQSPNSPLQDSESRRIRQLTAHRVRPFTEASECTILLAGLGGGTATETAPAIAQCTRTSVRPVISVVAIPFIHERERRFIALRGLKHMVDTCDCTIVIDNAMTGNNSNAGSLEADEKASAAVQTLTELISKSESDLVPEVLRILSLGQIGLICSAQVRTSDTIQSAVIKALQSSSANLPLVNATGAILLHRGPTKMGDGEAERAYQALVSLIGKDFEFLHTNVESSSEATVHLLLTGYDYGTAIRAFVDFIEDLYDVEYGQPSEGLLVKFQASLSQME